MPCIIVYTRFKKKSFNLVARYNGLSITYAYIALYIGLMTKPLHYLGTGQSRSAYKESFPALF